LPDIVADAAHAIIIRPSAEWTGHCFIDEDVLSSQGISDFSPYRAADSAALRLDFWIGTPPAP